MSNYMGFDKLKASLAKRGVRDPGGLASYIGRKKDGKRDFQAAAKAGRKITPGSKGYGKK